MKEIAKSIILGISIIIAVLVYVLGTRYQAIAKHAGYGDQIIIYDRISGQTK